MRPFYNFCYWLGFNQCMEHTTEIGREQIQQTDQDRNNLAKLQWERARIQELTEDLTAVQALWISTVDYKTITVR